MDDQLAELKKISKILMLVNAEKLETELAKYANTPERKKGVGFNRRPKIAG